MTKTIQVLATMASDASLQSEQAIEQLLTTAEVTAEQAEAIINKDVISLERQLDVRPDIYCALFPAEDEESSDDKQENEESDTEIKTAINA